MLLFDNLFVNVVNEHIFVTTLELLQELLRVLITNIEKWPTVVWIIQQQRATPIASSYLVANPNKWENKGI